MLSADCLRESFFPGSVLQVEPKGLVDSEIVSLAMGLAEGACPRASCRVWGVGPTLHLLCYSFALPEPEKGKPMRARFFLIPCLLLASAGLPAQSAEGEAALLERVDQLVSQLTLEEKAVYASVSSVNFRLPSTLRLPSSVW